MTGKEKLLSLAKAGVAGRHWYDHAQRNIKEHCTAHGWDPAKFTATLAALSPQVSVLQNTLLTVGWFGLGKYPRALPSVQTGFDRLRAANYAEQALGGPKVYAFARALRGDPYAVVLDTHMAKAFNVSPRWLVRAREGAVNRIAWVSRQLNTSPAETQAMIWTAVRDRLKLPYMGLDLAPAIQQWGLVPGQPTRRLGYKLFRVRKDGSIGSLFCSTRDRLPQDKWMWAQDCPARGLAPRPGWHVLPRPHAPHLTEEGRRWYRVEVDHYYTINRPATQGGEWLIARRMRILNPVSP